MAFRGGFASETLAMHMAPTSPSFAGSADAVDPWHPCFILKGRPAQYECSNKQAVLLGRLCPLKEVGRTYADKPEALDTTFCHTSLRTDRADGLSCRELNI